MKRLTGLLLILPLTLLLMFSCQDEPAGPDTNITTGTIEQISCHTAMASASIDAEIFSSVTVCGFCWNTTENPVISGNGVSSDVVAQDYTSIIEGLLIETTYYVRAYYVTNEGTFYGNEVSFTTEGCDAFTYGAKTYAAVQIGNQCWMAENLQIGSDLLTPANMNNNGIVERYAYDNDPLNYSAYGALYQWGEVVSYQTQGSNNNPSGLVGIAPPGWHIPSDAEWMELEIHLGMNSGVANTSGWRGTVADHLKAGGSSGFEMEMGGFSTTAGIFADGACYAYYWTSSSQGPTDAWYRLVDKFGTGIKREYGGHLHGMSVRCVKD